MKKILLITLLFSFLFSPLAGSFVYTEEEAPRRLEVEYPEIGGFRPVYMERDALPEYVIYIVQFLIFLAASITVFTLVTGGLIWVTAEGDPMKAKEGKERVASSVFGLIIVLSSVAFLSAISPTLIELEHLEEVAEIESPIPPGIYLSSRAYITEDLKEMGEDVFRITSSNRNLRDMGEGTRSLRIVNQLNERGELMGYYYGVVIHELPAFRGRCEFFINDSVNPRDFSIPEDIASITIIRINADPPETGEVMAYARPDFNENHPYQTLRLFTERFTPLSIGEVWSIDIEGSYGVILGSGDSWQTTGDGCGVFLDSKPLPDLKGHHMNRCNPRREVPYYAAYDSCATHYITLPLFR